MNDINLLTVASGIVATLFGLLMLVLGWLGNKLYDKVSDMSETMTRIDGALHKRISEIDRRVTALEVRCSMYHEGGA